MDALIRDCLKWYNNDVYTRLGSDVSVTELLNPPRMIHLMDRHRGKNVETDIDAILPALIGNGLHDQLQKYLRTDGKVSGKWKVERKLTSVIDGVRLTGRFDCMYNDTDMYDIKVTKIYKAMKALKGDVDDWEKQLNTYDYMLSNDGIKLKSLNICMVVLDWNKSETYKQNYPKSRLSIIPISKWTKTEQERWLKTLIGLWKTTKYLKDDELPLCSPKDRWADAPVYKLYRNPKHKRATKVFPTKQRALDYLKKCQDNDTEHKWDNGIINRSFGNPWRRCEQWCNAAPYCNQFQNKQEK